MPARDVEEWMFGFGVLRGVGFMGLGFWVYGFRVDEGPLTKDTHSPIQSFRKGHQRWSWAQGCVCVGVGFGSLVWGFGSGAFCGSP